MHDAQVNNFPLNNLINIDIYKIQKIFPVMEQLGKQQNRQLGGTSILQQSYNAGDVMNHQQQAIPNSNHFGSKGNRTPRSQLNGGSGVVKSLLTGQKYVEQSPGRTQRVQNKNQQLEDLSINPVKLIFSPSNLFIKKYSEILYLKNQ